MDTLKVVCVSRKGEERDREEGKFSFLSFFFVNSHLFSVTGHKPSEILLKRTVLFIFVVLKRDCHKYSINRFKKTSSLLD